MGGVAGAARAFVLAALVGGSLLVAHGTAGAQVGERILAYDVHITIDSDGALRIVEQIDYDFGGYQRHGIFRDIPVRFQYDDRYDRVYPVDVLSVEGSPGTPAQYEEESEGALLRIRIGDPDRTISGRHTYTITYRVEGALNGFSDHDELYWNAIGHDWAAPIDQAIVRVSAPAEPPQVACFAGPRGSNLACAAAEVGGRTATFRHGSLLPYEGLTVVVALPRGAVPAPAPILDERWSLSRAFSVTPATVSLTAALLLAAGFGVGRLLWVEGRDRRAVGSPIDVAYGTVDGGEQAVPLFEEGTFPVEYGPPDGVRPGQIGTLFDEVANPLDVTATIVDLGVRGYLRIEEIPKRWFFGKPDWRLVKLREADGGLHRYEHLLFNGLFEVPEEWEELFDQLNGTESVPARPDVPQAMPVPADPGLARVKLSSLRKQFATRLRSVQNALYDDAFSRGWFAARPDKIRQKWAGRGWLLFVAGAGLTWLAAARTHFGLVPTPIALAGLALAIGSGRMPRRTAKGTGLVRRIRGFRTYIATAEVDESRFAEARNLFSQYLPYAVVFGLTEKWAAAFARLGEQPPDTTGWYVGSRPFTVDGFASSMESFTVTTAGTIASTPSSSGSSGFGGGGSSGGGGGGGGGGSW